MNSLEGNPDRTRTGIALAGCLLLSAAPFSPIFSVPVIGRVTLMTKGNEDGPVLLIVALLALGLCMFGRFAFLWVSGTLGAFVFAHALYAFYFILPDTIKEYRKEMEGNPFTQLGEVALLRFEPDWGMILLLIGSLASLWAAYQAGFSPAVARFGRRYGVKAAVTVVAIILTYAGVMYFFPYLRYWRSLL